MSDKTDLTIQALGKRSTLGVMVCTLLFALGGSALLMMSYFASFASVGAFWGIWVPFCCLFIPALHHLSRELIQTKARLANLEAKLDATQTADTPSDGDKHPV